MRKIMVPGSLMAVLLGLGAMSIPPSAQAQVPPPTQPTSVEVTEEQLDRFANAYQAVQEIQIEAQAEMAAAIEGEGLTVEEFNTIAQTMQSPAASEIPSQQAEPFMAAAEQVATIQASVPDEIAAAIQAENMTLGEFEQILIMAQQDPGLQQQINQRLQM